MLTNILLGLAVIGVLAAAVAAGVLFAYAVRALIIGFQLSDCGPDESLRTSADVGRQS